MDLSNTAFSELRNSFPQLSDTTLRNSLAVFGFKGDEVFSKIADLSGGERARVSLCKLMLTGANLLILDEPTNHLDIYSVAALETALSLFSGTVLADFKPTFSLSSFTFIITFGTTTINELRSYYCETLY